MEILGRLDAEHEWKLARRKVLYQKVVCHFKECSVDLLSFEKVRSSLHLDQKFYRGLQEIPLELIRGSVGRFDDFTAGFLPLKKHMEKRWERVDVAMAQGKTPPIDLYQVGQVYFVLDGNHRVSVARQHGRLAIEAYVWEFPTPVDFAADAGLDEILIETEQAEFLERAGQDNVTAAASIRFTCAGCYKDISQQVEQYRQGGEKTTRTPVSFEQAFSAWYDEAYRPAIEAIRQNELLSQFPGRTEADLFIWSWQNSNTIEKEELAADPRSGLEKAEKPFRRPNSDMDIHKEVIPAGKSKKTT